MMSASNQLRIDRETEVTQAEIVACEIYHQTAQGTLDYTIVIYRRTTVVHLASVNYGQREESRLWKAGSWR
jgi:hypothetical protein